MNKIRSSQVMNRRWNKKESYMFDKNNIMRHIKFLSSCYVLHEV